MRHHFRDRINLDKVIVSAIVVNALQIVAALTVALFSIATQGHAFTGLTEQMLSCTVSLVVIWGAVLDIREAFSARRMGEEAHMLEDAYNQLEDLNNTLRAQRHDFMNHLQVVYSLIEMEENQEARSYIEQVYGDIQKVGRALKTAVPALNALLAAKLSDCEAKGIQMRLDIRSSFEKLPVSDWEMCRILGNLIDNAMDALKQTEHPAIEVSTWENLHTYGFRVKNNGPKVPRQIADKIFEQGFSTKSTGRGMGLHIVEEILGQYGGKIMLRSDQDETCFEGEVPKSYDAISEIKTTK